MPKKIVVDAKVADAFVSEIGALLMDIKNGVAEPEAEMLDIGEAIAAAKEIVG